MGAGASSDAGLGGGSGRTGLGDLPEGCVAEIMLRLDATQICSLARLSRVFRGAASADFVWETKLPRNYRYLLSRALGEESSGGRELGKKQIFALLCRRNAFDGEHTVWVNFVGSFSYSIGMGQFFRFLFLFYRS